MSDQMMFQVSTLQALMLGYSRQVITVGELLEHGDTGLGTFEDVNGEMILLDGVCCRAMEDGSVVIAPPDMGVPFTSVTFLEGKRKIEIGQMSSIDELKTFLNLRIEEDFGLNSMHVVRIDGEFSIVDARSEAPYRSAHVTLKDVLSITQKAFVFENIKGTLVCIYYPDYMDGINAPGWHLHFLSEDKTKGGHVFDLKMKSGVALIDKINCIKIQMPTSPAFDTYSLKNVSQDEVSAVEQGKG